VSFARRLSITEVLLSASSLAALALTAALLVLPGLALGWAAGARWLTAATTAPLLSFGLVTLVSRVTTATGLPWVPVSFLVGAVLLVALVRAARWAVTGSGAGLRLGRRLPWSDLTPATGVPVAGQLAALGAAVVAALVGTGAAVWGMGGLTSINQGFDGMFHTSAIQLIKETRNADPASLGAVNHFGNGSSYYPDGFHALAALVADLGLNSVVAANALVAAVPAVLAFGLVALLWQLGLRRHAVVAPFVGISIAAFPTDLMWRGPIWAFALGLALIPAMLALLLGAFEAGSRALAFLAAVGAAGMLLVHPSAALATGVFAAAYFVQRWRSRPGTFRADLLPLLLVTITTVLLALPAIITALNSSGYGFSYDHPVAQNAGEALGALFLFNYDAPLPQVWLFVLLVLGLAHLRGLRTVAWWWGTGFFFAVLMVMAAGYKGRVVSLLTGPWWNDRFRFAGLAVLGLGLICTHGLVVLGERLASVLGAVLRRAGAAGRPRLGAVVPVASLVAVLAVFGMLSGGFYADYNRSRMHLQYALGTGGSITPPELAGLDRLAQVVGPGEVVMNDPNDGSGWMWGRHGIRPLFGAAVLTPIRPPLEAEEQTMFDHFACIDSDESVRRVAQQYNIRHVYVGQDFIIPTMTRAPGMRDLSMSRSLRLIYDNGGAQIYEIVPAAPVPRDQDAACLAAEKPEAHG
jgi:hypothetical protein